MDNYTEYVVTRNHGGDLIVLELLKTDGKQYINKVFAGPFKTGELTFNRSDISSRSKRVTIASLFERV